MVRTLSHNSSLKCRIAHNGDGLGDTNHQDYSSNCWTLIRTDLLSSKYISLEGTIIPRLIFGHDFYRGVSLVWNHLVGLAVARGGGKSCFSGLETG